MKVLVVGGGGREHALVWKIAQSPLVKKIYCAPGNAGIDKLASCIPIGAAEIDKLLAFARDEKIDLTVVGPEDPLSKGIVDQFEGAGMRIVSSAGVLVTRCAFLTNYAATWGGAMSIDSGSTPIINFSDF